MEPDGEVQRPVLQREYVGVAPCLEVAQLPDGDREANSNHGKKHRAQRDKFPRKCHTPECLWEAGRSAGRVLFTNNESGLPKSMLTQIPHI